MREDGEPPVPGERMQDLAHKWSRAFWLPVCLSVVLGATEVSAVDLTIKLVDGVSGLPTEARVEVYRPDGWAFQTMDPELLTHYSANSGHYVHATDSLVVSGPVGPWAVWVSSGITGIPETRTFTYLDADSTLVIEGHDWIDPRLDGWYGADPHIHLFHDGGLYYDEIPHDRAAMAARAEGLDLMYLLENDADHPSGPVVPAQPGVTLVWGEEYRNSFWGHTVWLGLDELVWYPFSGAGCCGELFGAWPTLSWTFAEVDAGLRVLAHPRSTDEPLAAFAQWPGSGYARERAALALGDLLDGFAVASASNEGEAWAFDDYLDALRAGARWAAVGEGDRALDRYEVSPPGQPRTYAWIGPGWSPGDPAMVSAWEDAVRDRRCYATTGVVVRDFDVGGVPMGGEYEAGAAGTVDVSFSVAAYRPLTRVTLHGATGTHWEFTPGPGKTALDTTVTVAIAHDDFVMLDAQASVEDWHGLVFPPRAVASPVWVDAGTPWPLDAASARDAIEDLENFFAQAVELRGFESPSDSIGAWNDIVGAAARYEAMVDDPPATFELLSPDDGAQIVAPTVELRWSESVSHDAEPVLYRLQVARDPAFVDVIADLHTIQTLYQLPGTTESRNLYWKVEAIEPGEPATVASNAPRDFFLTGGVVDAPAFEGAPLELLSSSAVSGGFVVSLRLRDPLDVAVRWVDVRGRVAGRENLGRLSGGTRRFTLVPRDREGRVLARGVYWLVAEGGPYRDVARVVWLR